MDMETVKKISEVARLHMNEEELKQLTAEMDELLGHFKVVQEIKSSKSSHAKGKGADEGDAISAERKSAHFPSGKSGAPIYMHDLKNTLREDTPVKCNPKTTEAIRKEFTKSEGKYLSAPKSIK